MSNSVSKIIYLDELPPDYERVILEGLSQNAFDRKGVRERAFPFAYIIQDEHKEFLGGISGYHYYGCSSIDLLFVKESARNKGYGEILMQKAESLAKERGSLFITVNAMDFEARPFYEKLGFNGDSPGSPSFVVPAIPAGTTKLGEPGESLLMLNLSVQGLKRIQPCIF